MSNLPGKPIVWNICTGRMTKNQQKFMARKALPIFAYSWLFLAIFGLFANSFINFYLFANIHKSAVLFAPFFFAFFGLFLPIFLCSTCVCNQFVCKI